jgi:hypothetical protein
MYWTNFHGYMWRRAVASDRESFGPNRPFAYTLQSGARRTKGIVFALDPQEARERAAGIARDYYGEQWSVLEVQRVEPERTTNSARKGKRRRSAKP